MDLYRINLNLLVALDVLLSEHTVTDAAKKLSISQAAMSNNLQQLRQLLKDDLLQRKKNQMVLTSYAKELRTPLREILSGVGDIFDRGRQFDLKQCDRTFKVGIFDYFAELIFPKLIAIMQRYAPSLKINIIPLTQIYSAEPFEKEQYDIGIGRAYVLPESIQGELLLKDKAVCVLNRKHPLAKKKKITLADYSACEHISWRTQNPQFHSWIDQTLIAKGFSPRKTVLHLPFVDAVFSVIEKSNQLIASVVKSATLLVAKRHRCVLKPFPLENEFGVEFYIAWHKQMNNDPAHRWLREQIIRIVKEIKMD